MASFYCQELIKNTLHLCQSYIQKLLQDKGVLKGIENELSLDEDLLSVGEGDPLNKRTSYYVEENEKILNLLITNC